MTQDVAPFSPQDLEHDGQVMVLQRSLVVVEVGQGALGSRLGHVCVCVCVTYVCAYGRFACVRWDQEKRTQEQSGRSVGRSVVRGAETNGRQW